MKKYQIATADNWVNISGVDTTQSNDESSPFYFYLVDYQELILENKICTYKRTVEHINDVSRLEDASLYLFELQEENHHLVFHAIDIIRNGERFNALIEDKISINQREKSLENHITNKRQTVSISIDDLRVGDIIDYSATDIIEASDHPLIGKYYHTTFWLNWNCPVYKQTIRILNQSKKVIKLQHCALKNGVLNSDTTDIQPGQTFNKEYINLPSMPIEEVAPNWLWSDFLLATTDLQWEQLSVYLYQYYISQDILDCDIGPKDLSDIQLTDKTAENIIKIVRFVQNEIRYKSENHGVFTHTPKNPEHTLQKRYGDCKDKSNLLVALLNHINVNAHLTLVNTDYGIKIGQLNPSPYHFNHMIVHIEFDGKDYYFDPTIKKQAGDLQHCASLNFGYGLILSDLGSTLKKIPHSINQEVYKLKHIFELSNLKKNEGTLSIHRIYLKHRADNMRYHFQSTENRKLAGDFLKYAKEETDLNLKIEKPITTVEDNENLNTLETEEIYSINNLSETNKDQLLHLLTAIYLEFPTTTNLEHPLRIDLDGCITHDIEVIYNGKPLQTNDSKSINNPWFSYQDSISKQDNILYLSATATPKKQYVDSKDIDSYLVDVENMRLRSMNNFPYVSGDSSFFSKMGNWMLYSSGVIIFILLLLNRLAS